MPRSKQTKAPKAPRCTGKTKAGTRCRLTVVSGHSRCHLHLDYAGDLIEALANLAISGSSRSTPSTPSTTSTPTRSDMARWAYYHALKPALQGLPIATPLSCTDLKAYTDSVYATLTPNEHEMWAEFAKRLGPCVTL